MILFGREIWVQLWTNIIMTRGKMSRPSKAISFDQNAGISHGKLADKLLEDKGRFNEAQNFKWHY